MNTPLRITWLSFGIEHGQWVVAPGYSGIITKYHYEFTWIRQGNVHVGINGETHDGQSGDIYLFQPGQVVRWCYDKLEPSMVYIFYFDLESIPSDYPPPKNWPLKRSLPENDIIRPLFEYVAGHGGPNPSHTADISPAVNSAIETMMSAFVSGQADRPQSFPHSYPPAILRLLSWIREQMGKDPGRKITAEELAAVAGVSQQHLSRLFHQHLGYSPTEVLYIFRLTRSLIGLRAGRKVEAVALELGFADAAHFSRRFRALFGKTPTTMQKALAKGFQPKRPNVPFMND